MVILTLPDLGYNHPGARRVAQPPHAAYRCFHHFTRIVADALGLARAVAAEPAAVRSLGFRLHAMPYGRNA